jgi:hypothetical protein
MEEMAAWSPAGFCNAVLCAPNPGGQNGYIINCRRIYLGNVKKAYDGKRRIQSIRR